MTKTLVVLLASLALSIGLYASMFAQAGETVFLPMMDIAGELAPPQEPDAAPAILFTWPHAGAHEEVSAITVHFSERMLHGSLEGAVRLEDAGSQSVAGQVDATDSITFTTLLFIPADPLVAGSYTLTVDSAATDLAGNSLAAPFSLPFVHVPVSQVSAGNSGPTSVGSSTTLTAAVPGESPAISYTWSLGDGATAYGAVVDHIYPAVGVYTATVTAAIGDNQAQISTTVTIVDQPIAGPEIVHNGPTALTTATVFTASVLEGSNVTYTWDFGDGATGQGVTVTHVYTGWGHYTATVWAANSVSEEFAQTTLAVFTVEKIAGGAEHTCALTTIGSMLCWGSNEWGQTGTGWELEVEQALLQTPWFVVPVPAPVLGLSSGVADIAARAMHSCAVTTDGTAKCWGPNFVGENGNGTEESSLEPVDVVGLEGNASRIEAGDLHTCVITRAGGVKCWGSNENRQLGEGMQQFIYTVPVDVSGLYSDVISIALGGSHTCALMASGGVKCWGLNNYFQLGVDEQPHVNTPKDVPGMESGVAAIAAGGAHTCALMADGGVMCWGSNESGQLGDGNAGMEEMSLTPVAVVGLEDNVAAIAAGGSFTCALTTDSRVECWGSNSSGQLGIDSEDLFRSTPVEVTELPAGVATIGLGEAHTCAVTLEGETFCWGRNNAQQLGTGSDATRVRVPMPVVWSRE